MVKKREDLHRTTRLRLSGKVRLAYAADRTLSHLLKLAFNSFNRLKKRFVIIGRSHITFALPSTNYQFNYNYFDWPLWIIIFFSKLILIDARLFIVLYLEKCSY